MNIEEAEKNWLQLPKKLRTWKSGKKRAPHKPLLLLLLITRAFKGKSREVSFLEIEKQLENLLKEFGHPKPPYHPEYPFWHLETDGIWELENAENINKSKSKSASKKELVENNVVGGIVKNLWEPLCQNSELRQNLVEQLLENFWPSTLHQTIKEAIGFSEELNFLKIESKKRKRNRYFREEILKAYQKRCAICGYDGRISDVLLGLEAAHIQWHAYEGPDSIENGIALCSFHHVALDRGAIGINNEYRILVSSHVSGQSMVEELLYQFNGKFLREPQPGSRLKIKYLQWHRNNVFKEPERHYFSA